MIIETIITKTILMMIIYIYIYIYIYNDYIKQK